MKLITDADVLSKLNEWGSEFVTRLKAELWNQKITASGNLADSIEYRISDEGDGTHITIYSDYYMPYAEAGRKAGNVPRRFGDILAEWVRDKGIAVPSKFKDEYQFGWAIAYNIKHYGSKRYRNNDIADVVSPVTSEMTPRLNDIVTNRIVIYLNDSIYK